MPTSELAVSPVVAAAAREFAESLRRAFGREVLKVRLFGSFAKGGADEESDVDVAVVLERVDWETRKRVIDLATDTGLERGLYLSPTLFDRPTYERWLQQERALVLDIEAEGLAL